MKCYLCNHKITQEELEELINEDDAIVYLGEVCKKCLKEIKEN